MPSYSQGASAFFERYNPYAFAVLCSGLALFVAISRLARWRAHGDSFEVDDEAAKRCNVLNVALLPAYELVLIGKLLCVVSVPFVGAAVMAYMSLRCDVYVPLVILWRFVLEVNGFSNMVVLYFLVAPSGGTKTMKISLALAFISAVLITLCATFEDYSPSITHPCYTDWGTSFLSTALPTWLQPGDGTNTLFMSAWCVIFFSGLVMLLLLVMVAKTAVPQLCPWNPRQGWLALSALGLLLCQNVILSHANYKGDELGSYFGFDITFLILAIEEPIWYYIFWRDSRYWMHFTFDGDTTPAALDRLASDPLKSAMATEMFTRGQGRRAPHIPYNHITFEKILASGAAGTVWRCAVSGLRGDRAVKRMQCAEINKKTVSSLCKEVELSWLSWLLCSGCRHIVRMDGFTVSPPDICVVMQLCDCGSLLEVLGGRVVRVDRLRLAAETAAAVAHLHMLDIVHRDLKSLNVMCSVSQGVTTSYLGDFGESLTVEEAAEEVPRQVGTVPWMAPEIIENWKVMARTRLEDGNPFMGTHYSKASDCFSLAVIAWECEVQRAPYAHFPLHPTRKRPLLDADRLMLGDFIVDKGLRPNTEEADVIPAEVLAVLESGWHADPIQRMAASQMKSALDRECNAIECNCQRSTDNAANTEPLGGEPEVLIEMAEGSTALEDRVPSC